MTYARSLLETFALANPLYVNASVSFFTVDANGNATATLANLYSSIAGVAKLPNPQILDSHGKFKYPVYIDQAVIGVIASSQNVPQHDTGVIANFGRPRGSYAVGVQYNPNDLVQDPISGNIYIANQVFTSTSIAADIASGKLVIFLQPASLVSANIAGSSVTSNSIALGPKTFTTQPNLNLNLGSWVTVTSAANVANNMFGQITAYNALTGVLTVNVTVIGGSGTAADWIIELSGRRGADGGIGPPGGLGNTGPAGINGIAPNHIINGDMSVWQRGGSFPLTGGGAGTPTADRWFAGQTGTSSGNVSRIALTSVFKDSLRIQRVAGSNSTQVQYLFQPLITKDSLPLANRTVTLSFYARCGADYSATGKKLLASIVTGTGTDQSSSGVLSGSWAGWAQTPTQDAVLTPALQRFSMQFPIGNVSQVAPFFSATPTGTAGANDWIEVTGVKLEASNTVSPFNYEARSQTILKCQEYYYKTFPIDVPPANGADGSNCPFLFSASGIGGALQFNIRYPVPMRVIPTCSILNPVSGSPSTIYNVSSGTSVPAFAYVIGLVGCVISNVGTITAGNTYAVHTSFDAEL